MLARRRRVRARLALRGACGALAMNLSLGTADAGAADAPPRCAAPLPVLADGELVGRRCPDELAAAGLTAIDLSDGWAPFPLDGAATAAGAPPPAYRAIYVDLENHRPGEDQTAAVELNLELYGIAPSLRVVLAAMDDEARHRCHDAIDDAALEAAPLPLRMEGAERATRRQEALRRARAQVAALRRRHRVDTPAALRSLGPIAARAVDRLARQEAIDGAIRAIQDHLACEGLLSPRRRAGVFAWETARALAIYQRRSWIVASGELDADTRAALRASSRELDLRLALRALRTRVTDAAGILEDGSALGAWGTVLGRALDPEDLRYQGDYPPLPGGAPDRVSAATEAAARALGWRDFASARASIRRLLAEEGQRVAVRLPPPPAYVREGIELRAVILAGDATTAARSPGRVTDPRRRPVLIVYARDGAREVPLIRWPTTFGGWRPERRPGGAVVRRFKPSDLGPRVWRDLVVAPVWYAPKSTPEDELLVRRGGRWTVREELIGPGYRSAYGLAMLIHHEAVARRGEVRLVDHGIRSHGSVSYRSILVGESHGCHRLYNHQMTRLATFLLRRRAHVVRGPLMEPYSRRLRAHGRTFTIQRHQRGFAYELTPPIPVEVIAGTEAPSPGR